MSNLRYSIKDLENFTNIKAHTIRIWEQRYGLLSPKRTETNIRYYSEDDLKKILNINLLYNSGYKISKIAGLSESEIVENAKSIILSSASENQSEIDKLTLLILDFKGIEIKEFIENALKASNLVEVYENLFIPLLQKIGELWQVNSIGVIHEHYFSTIFRQQLISEIDELKTTIDPLKTALLFLHDNEEHEFGILMYYYLLRQNGYNCHYFGQKAPIEEVQKAHSQIKPQIVVSTFTAKISDKNFTKAFSVLESMSKSSQVIVSGSQLTKDKPAFSKSILHIKSIDQLKKIIA